MNSPQEALTDGRLPDAIALQEAVLAAQPDDPAARLFLAELLLIAGRFSEAARQFHAVPSTSPDWPAVRWDYLQTIQAEQKRSETGRRPIVLDYPIPRHLRRRRQAQLALGSECTDAAVAALDRADRYSPLLFGHVDGREFEGFRDADDRFASLLELFIGAEYAWVSWEAIRTLRLAPSRHLFDTVYRPARLSLVKGETLDVVVPLLYPGSYRDSGDCAIELDTDWIDTGGLSVGVGARTLFVGEDELLLRDCTQIEFRG